MSILKTLIRTQKVVVDSARNSISVVNAGPAGPAGASGADGGMTGEIRMWAASTTPATWLECDGSEKSRTTYATLFALIGTTWGAGNGTTTFNVPDLRGRAPVGVGTGSGLTARTLGSTAGAEAVTLSAAQSGLKSHVHNIDPPNTTVSVTDPGHNHTQNAHNHNYLTDSLVFHPSASAGGSGAAVPNSFSSTDKRGAAVPNTTATNNSATTGISAEVNIAAFDSASVADAAGSTPVSLVQPIAAVKFIIKA